MRLSSIVVQVLQPAPLRLLAILFGVNRRILPSSQHVPSPRSKKSLRAMIRSTPDSTRVLLLAPPPINTHQRPVDLAPEKLELPFDVTKPYAEAVKVISAEENVPVADVWTAM
ncbi:hypothetical protein K488DRAFT_86776 [Vararia minispora EC-137]|uniref:Uncharacterized protein n=1 Tax=Vararia minispora EC-137 TaxID=1314806 RepID=A0ACB8QIH2_9AGAM|nr:hypothetical protein K488DRAFT_86776 [Vararia minispora EC-137]